LLYKSDTVQVCFNHVTVLTLYLLHHIQFLRCILQVWIGLWNHILECADCLWNKVTTCWNVE